MAGWGCGVIFLLSHLRFLGLEFRDFRALVEFIKTKILRLLQPFQDRSAGKWCAHEKTK